MVCDLSVLAGWALTGWDLDLSNLFRLHLVRLDFGTGLGREYAKCEALFRSPAAVGMTLDQRERSMPVVEQVRSRKDADGQEVHHISFGPYGEIEVTADEHVVVTY